jgi:drug/metabolite transporter (DMT)-like permease
MLAAFMTTMLFSLSAISGRRLSNHMGGTQANLTRLLLAATLLGLWSHVFGFGLGRNVFWILFLSGCVGFGVGDLALFQAYPRIGTRRTVVLTQCLAAPFAALAEWVWLGHAPTLAQAAFGLLILAGVAVALMPGKAEAQPTHGLTAGILFGILAALGQGGGAVISRKAYALAAAADQAFHTPADGVNAAYQRLLGGIAVSGLFFLWLKIAHRPDEMRKADWPRAWPWLAGNTVAGPALGVACFQWALMTTPTTIVLPIVATVPLAVMPLEHLLKGEQVTHRAVVGGVIAVAGVIGLTLAR